MEVRNNSNMSFQARVPKVARDVLKNEAINYGGKTMRALRNKISEVSTWGSRDSVIDLSYFDRANGTISFAEPFDLVLSNPSAKLADEVVLSAGKKSVFQNFMALTENDIVSAERELNANTAPKSVDLFV